MHFFKAVAKFICKAKVLPEGWVPSPKRGNRMVPIELHLLETLSHPNIVKVTFFLSLISKLLIFFRTTEISFFGVIRLDSTHCY